MFIAARRQKIRQKIRQTTTVLSSCSPASLPGKLATTLLQSTIIASMTEIAPDVMGSSPIEREPGRPPSPRRRSTSYHSRARSLERGVPPRRAFSTNQSTTSTTSAASNSSTGRRCACRNSTLARCSPPQHPLPDPGSRKRERRHGEQEHHHLPETVPSP